MLNVTDLLQSLVTPSARTMDAIIPEGSSSSLRPGAATSPLILRTDPDATTQSFLLMDSGSANLSDGNPSGGLFLPDGPNSTVPCLNDYCVSDDEYLDMLLDYIFPTPFEWCLIVAYAIIFVVGLVGNFLVCLAVWRNPGMRTVTNYFIVNLAVADFLVILICMPPTVLDDVTETWYMGSYGCKVVKYLQGGSVSVSVLTLSSISVERWYAICQPLKFKSTPTRAKVIIILTWFVAMVIVIPELVSLDTYSRIEPELSVLLTACKPTWSNASQSGYQMFLIAALYFLPLLLMFGTYMHIGRCLWSTTIPTENSRDQLKHCEGGRSNFESQLQSRRKAAKMLIAVVVMFACCYLPVHLLNILRYAGSLATNKHAIYFALVAHWTCYFNSAINPVIYNFMSAKFRREFRSAFVCCRLCFGKENERPVGQGDNRYTYKYTNALYNSRINRDNTTRTRMTTLRV